MIQPITNTIKENLQEKLKNLSNLLNGDVFTYFGIIADGNENIFMKLIEDIDNKKEKIFIILTTGGGSAIAVERYVNILRYHYKEVNFIVPDYAFSAGTIFV
jgi:ClpP class serine protease